LKWTSVDDAPDCWRVIAASAKPPTMQDTAPVNALRLASLVIGLFRPDLELQREILSSLLVSTEFTMDASFSPYTVRYQRPP
jgi:hypothetical protein